MPLLFFTEHYPPDQSATARYLGDIADEISHDWSVIVFSGTPGSAGLLGPDHVHVRQISSKLPEKSALVRRFFAMLRFSIKSFVVALRYAGPRHPVMVVTTPFVLPYFIVLAAKLRRAPSCLILFDLYPEAIIAAGLQRESSSAVRMIRRMNRFMYKTLTCVVMIGRDMERHLVAYGCDKEKIVCVPNWATVEPRYRAVSASNPFRSDMQCKLVIGMSGNLGFTHDPITPVEAAARLSHDTAIHFLFSGWGAGWQKLQEHVKRLELTNVTLIDRVSKEKLTDFLAAADVWILPYRRGMAGVSVPSRLYNILAVGRPVIALSDADSEQALIAQENDLGWVCPPEDPEALATLIEQISAHRDDATGKGKRAVQTVCAHYVRSAAGARYRDIVRRLFKG